MTRLSVLDLAPIPSGGTARDALRNTVDLARRAEDAGYHRYWLAEHHLTPGVASAAPAVLIGAVAAATRRIRVGSGAVQLGHQTPLTVVEQFGTLDALHPGRIDLGIGRSGQRARELREAPPEPAAPAAARTVKGLLIPPPFSFTPAITQAPIFALALALLQQPGAQSPDFAEQVDDIVAFLSGSYRSDDGHEAHAQPGEGAELELWVLGSSGGQSAQVAAERGLPFAANYHVSPATVLEAVDAYRDAFKPSQAYLAPHVMVSADVLVAPTEEEARRIGEPYGLWVRSIRTGAGAMKYPSPEEASAHEWTEDDRALVADRLDTRFAGTPEKVVEGLRVLKEATGADELLVTTIAYDHADRVRSQDLLAEAWADAGV
ncbi:LLM class flavin-dependent oxidoreductase [Microbispora sp. H11081]|uniref:LLM class flavin-dependent oxidoreductase n=1 Tax=Microbispora sp. H11081 TaxID=2729107 RepID=UPI0014731F59|nr:LLM class flavin-dependent oxidoreductase [Microbispora sp. H11081]